MHHSSIVHTIFVERSAIKMYGHSLTLCGINVNVSISYNVALHFFIFVPRITALFKLIEAVNKAGQTPLFLAYTNRRMKTVKYLVDIRHCNPKCNYKLINIDITYVCVLVCKMNQMDIVDCLYICSLCS